MSKRADIRDKFTDYEKIAAAALSALVDNETRIGWVLLVAAGLTAVRYGDAAAIDAAQKAVDALRADAENVLTGKHAEE